MFNSNLLIIRERQTVHSQQTTKSRIAYAQIQLQYKRLLRACVQQTAQYLSGRVPHL